MNTLSGTLSECVRHGSKNSGCRKISLHGIGRVSDTFLHSGKPYSVFWVKNCAMQQGCIAYP
jgi:hypothetical protein